MTKQEQSINQVFLAAQNWLIFFVLFAGSIYLASIIMTSFFPVRDDINHFSTEMKVISIQVLEVLKPFIELIIIFWLTDWALRKLGFGISKGFAGIQWNARTVIYLSLLFAFIITVIVLTEAMFYLKGVILLIAGIFIGCGIKLPSTKDFLNLNTKKETEITDVE